MPLSCDPNETAPVVLSSDQPKPADAQPVFEARFLTCSELRQVRKLIDQAYAAAGDAAEPLLDQILQLEYAGWRNVKDRAGKPIEPQRDADGNVSNFDDVLDLVDKWELVAQAGPTALSLHAQKKRSSSSPSPAPSASAPSAPNAAPAADASGPTPDPTDQTASTSPA